MQEIPRLMACLTSSGSMRTHHNMMRYISPMPLSLQFKVFWVQKRQTMALMNLKTLSEFTLFNVVTKMKMGRKLPIKRFRLTKKKYISIRYVRILDNKWFRLFTQPGIFRPNTKIWTVWPKLALTYYPTSLLKERSSAV